MVVETLVNGGHVDVHVGVVAADNGDALGGGDDVHQGDVPAAVLLDEVDGRGGGAAGGQHGVHDDNGAFGDVVGHLAVVFDGLVGVGVPEKADVAHAGGGKELQHGVHHAKAGPENGWPHST